MYDDKESGGGEEASCTRGAVVVIHAVGVVSASISYPLVDTLSKSPNLKCLQHTSRFFFLYSLVYHSRMKHHPVLPWLALPKLI